MAMKSTQDQEAFTLEEPRYDQTTYWGRFKTISEAASPLYAFVSSAEVSRQYELVKQQQAREKLAK